MRLRLSCLFCLLLCASSALAGYEQRPEVRDFIATMAARHDFSSSELQALFARIQPRQAVLDAISRPAEAKPWHRYRPIFLTERRIREGAGFLRDNRTILARAEAEYGVPAEIITAILGVETFYGRHRGRHPVFASLTTLAFDYPQRGRFFRGELEQFLLLVREEDMDPLSALGSYAGAMGLPQFIASSFRHYAVDFDGDGRRDIWNSTADAIGSIANYLQRHGWQRDAAIAVPARVEGSEHGKFAYRKKPRKPAHTVGKLRRHGIRPVTPLADETRAALLVLEAESGPGYWLTLHNFYVITRYNHSPLYAMAVYQLGREIDSLVKETSSGELAAHDH